MDQVEVLPLCFNLSSITRNARPVGSVIDRSVHLPCFFWFDLFSLPLWVPQSGPLPNTNTNTRGVQSAAAKEARKTKRTKKKTRQMHTRFDYRPHGADIHGNR